MIKRTQRGRRLTVLAVFGLLAACSGLSINLESDTRGRTVEGDAGAASETSGRSGAGDAGNPSGGREMVSSRGAPTAGNADRAGGGGETALGGTSVSTGGARELETGVGMTAGGNAGRAASEPHGDGGVSGLGGAGASVNDAGAGGEAFVGCYGDNWETEEVACFRGIPDAKCGGSKLDFKGCVGSGCTICRELVPANEYPYYFERHPCCSPNDLCSGTYFGCNPSCPEPNQFDAVAICGWYLDQYR